MAGLITMTGSLASAPAIALASVVTLELVSPHEVELEFHNTGTVALEISIPEVVVNDGQHPALYAVVALSGAIWGVAHRT